MCVCVCVRGTDKRPLNDSTSTQNSPHNSINLTFYAKIVAMSIHSVTYCPLTTLSSHLVTVPHVVNNRRMSSTIDARRQHPIFSLSIICRTLWKYANEQLAGSFVHECNKNNTYDTMRDEF